MLHYDSKTALITGGSSGIGFGIAQALVERGARVALVATDRQRLDIAVERLSARGGKAIGVTLDVTNRDGWNDAVGAIEAAFGQVDILVLNTGAQGGRRPVEEIPWDEWRWVWDVNVNGIYHGLAACLPTMKRRGSPAHVLITASIAALLPRANVVAYGAAKAAALAIGEAVRLELHGGPIGISVLCPAGVRSDIAETMRRHAPGADAATFAFMKSMLESGLDPLHVGRFTLDAIAAGVFYIFTHPEFSAHIEPRLDEIRATIRNQEALVPRVKAP